MKPETENEISQETKDDTTTPSGGESSSDHNGQDEPQANDADETNEHEDDKWINLFFDKCFKKPVIMNAVIAFALLWGSVALAFATGNLVFIGNFPLLSDMGKTMVGAAILTGIGCAFGGAIGQWRALVSESINPKWAVLSFLGAGLGVLIAYVASFMFQNEMFSLIIDWLS